MKKKLLKGIFKMSHYCVIGIVLVCFTTGFLSAGEVNSQSIRNVKISLELKENTLQEAFRAIEERTEFEFTYKRNILMKDDLFTLNVKDATVAAILEMIGRQARLSFRQINSSISVHPHNELRVTKEVAQVPLIFDTEISGRITDEESNPLPGVNIIVKGTSKGTVTDMNGEFRAVVPDEAILLISYIGFETQEISIANQTHFEITMIGDVNTLNEVVVVGYGTVQKKDLTGSVGTVQAKEIEQIKTQTIDQALVGKIAGVHVTASGGAPGSGAIVHVRGLSAIRGDNQPLYVIDGVPIVQNPNFGTLGLGTYGNRENPLLSINPNDVERIDVLKDASAAAIYGSRAANGVILITTKRGKRGMDKPRLTFSANSTIQNPTNRHDVLSADEFIDFAQGEAQKTIDNSPYPEVYWPILYPTELAILNDPEYFGDADVDWQDHILNRNAVWNEYNLGVSGGTDNINYLVSSSISDQEGVLIGNKFTRYNFSSRLDADVTERFTVGGSVSYNYSINKSSNILISDGLFRPDITPYNEDGTFTTFTGPYGTQFNPLGDNAKVKNKGISQNIYGSVYGELEIIDGLRLKSQININLNNDKNTGFVPSYTSTAMFYGLYYSEPGARLSNQSNAGVTTSFINTLNYNKLINNTHRIDVLAGISWDRMRLDLESQSYRGFPDDANLTNINSANFVDEFSSESMESGLNSLFTRVNYGFQDKYLATFTARYDGSTKFGPNNRYGFFPSGALAWNVHNEDFLKGNDLISQLKLRVSLGRTGSDNLPSFSYLAYYQSLENGDSFYDGKNGIAVPGIPNEDIKWETTDQLDVGLEFGLWNNRFNAEIVYFEKNTSGIILYVPIPAETGASNWNANVADVSNTGLEIAMGGDVISKGNFVWNSSLNLTFVKNNVDNLYGGQNYASSNSGIVEGYPIGVILGYDVVKIAQTPEEILALNNSAGGVYQSTLTQPGDYIFRDATGDGKITTDDRIPLGDINPDYYAGWNNTVIYKNFDLSFNFNLVQGPSREFSQISGLYYVNVASNSTTLIYDTWTPERTGAEYARLGSGSHGFTPTSQSVSDASYLRLRSLSLGFNLPENWLARMGIQNAKLTLSGNNLFTITDYPGLDPENVNTQRGGATIDLIRDQGYAYPQTKTMTVGLNVTL